MIHRRRHEQAIATTELIFVRTRGRPINVVVRIIRKLTLPRIHHASDQAVFVARAHAGVCAITVSRATTARSNRSSSGDILSIAFNYCLPEDDYGFPVKRAKIFVTFIL